MMRRAILLMAAMLAPGSARADSVVTLSGLDATSHSFYFYVGGIARLDGTFDGSGWVARLWADRLTYDYAGGSGTVKASSWGQSGSLGYEYNHDTGQVSGFLGIDARHTALQPEVSSPVAGEKTGARLELDLIQKIAPDLSFSGIGSYLPAIRDYWTRAQVLYATPLGFSIGPEAALQGNTLYQGRRLGLSVTDVTLFRGISLGVSGGYAKYTGFDGGAYGSVSLAATF